MATFVHVSLGGRVVFGPGRIREARAETELLGMGRVFLITSPGSGASGDTVAAVLGALAVHRWTEVREHVPVELVARALEAVRSEAADGIVSVGGGSATGLGKALVRETDVPFLAVPTTYSGSEMTPIWGVTGEHKQTGRDPRVKPGTVVYDPETTLGLPAEVTGPSAFNALAHCVEALYGPGANPLTAVIAEKGIELIHRSLPGAVESPLDVDARSDLLIGSWLAGMTIAEVGTALHHKLCHLLGGSLGIGHGDANAVLLPHVVAFNGAEAAGSLAPLCRALGVRDPVEAAEALAALAARIGAPTSLGALGVDRSALGAIARSAAADTTGNPRPLTPDDVEKLLEDAWDGRLGGTAFARPRLPK